MYRLIETLKSIDGIIQNFAYHQARANSSSAKLNHINFKLNLIDIILPDEYKSGIVKIRVTYSDFIESIQFEHYKLRQINSFRFVYDDEIDYSHKYSDRNKLDFLYSQRLECDDIIIVKNGKLTDSYYANLVFLKDNKYFTPDRPLLNGTKRQKLIEMGIIHPVNINISNYQDFDSVTIINSVIELFDVEPVRISKIQDK